VGVDRRTQKVGEGTMDKMYTECQFGEFVTYCRYKNLHQADTYRGLVSGSAVKYCTYRTFTVNTDWNMTNNLHFKSGGCPSAHPMIDAHGYIVRWK